MARKQETEVVEDVCVFPEEHVMHSWSRDDSPRENEIAGSRDRMVRKNPTKNKSQFHIPREWWPAGYQLGWMAEYVLNVPQSDNLRKRAMDGWEFVHESEIPQFAKVILDHEFDRGRDDGRLRTGGCILMKMPLEEYIEEQEAHRVEGEEIRRQSSALSEYLSNGRDPRNIVVDEHSYQPAYRHKGR